MKKFILQMVTVFSLLTVGSLFIGFNKGSIGLPLVLLSIPFGILFLRTMIIGYGKIIPFEELPPRYCYTFLEIRCGVVFLQYYGTAEIFHTVMVNNFPYEATRMSPGTDFTISNDGKIVPYKSPFNYTLLAQQ
jgi:hypothetical protein